MFWIVATFARCQKILAADGEPHLQHALAPAFETMAADLGSISNGDILRRAEEVTGLLPRLWETTETILSTDLGSSPRI